MDSPSYMHSILSFYSNVSITAPPLSLSYSSSISPLFPSYDSPFYSTTHNTNAIPSPNHFYTNETSTPNLSLSQNYSPLSASYNNLYGSGKRGYSGSDIPIFNGTGDGYWWILCIERYFKARGTPEASKVSVAVTALQGSALQWWLERHHHSKVSWDSFTDTFLWWFKPEYRDVLPLLEDGKEELDNTESLCSSFQAHTTLTNDSKESGDEEDAKSELLVVESFFVQENLIEEERDEQPNEKPEPEEQRVDGEEKPDLIIMPKASNREEDFLVDELFLPLTSAEVVLHGVEIFWGEQPPPKPPDPCFKRYPMQPQLLVKRLPPDKSWPLSDILFRTVNSFSSHEMLSPLLPAPPELLSAQQARGISLSSKALIQSLFGENKSQPPIKNTSCVFKYDWPILIHGVPRALHTCCQLLPACFIRGVCFLEFSRAYQLRHPLLRRSYSVVVTFELSKSTEAIFEAALTGNGFECTFSSAQRSSIKEWDPGDQLLVFTMTRFSQFKQWDPGKIVITSIFLQP